MYKRRQTNTIIGLLVLITIMLISIYSRLGTLIETQNSVEITKNCHHQCKDTLVSQAEDPVIEATVTGTYYNAVEGQCDASPLITADGSKIDLKKLKNREIRWVAVSRDLLSRWGGPFNYGDTIVIENKKKELCGRWVIHDTMNKRFRKRMDFLVALGNKFPGKTHNIIIKKSV